MDFEGVTLFRKAFFSSSAVTGSSPLIELLVKLSSEGIEVRVQGAGIFLRAFHLAGTVFPFAGQYATLCGYFCPLAGNRHANVYRCFTGGRVRFRSAQKEENGQAVAHKEGA